MVADDEAKAQLRWLLRRDRRTYNRIQDAIRTRLTHEPTREDTNRKPMHGSAAAYDAGWELRVQPYRIYYDVEEAVRRVRVVGIAHKPREVATLYQWIKENDG